MIVINDRKNFLGEDGIERHEERRQDTSECPEERKVEFSMRSHEKSGDDNAKTYKSFAGCRNAKENSREEDIEVAKNRLK